MLKGKDTAYCPLIKIGYFSGDFVKLASTLNIDSMPFIGNEELDQIKDDLRNLIQEVLMANYKDHTGNSLDSIERMGIDIEFDEDTSTRDRVVIAKIEITAVVWVKKQKFDSISNDFLRLKNNKPLKTTYNSERTKYEFENFDDITFIGA